MAYNVMFGLIFAFFAFQLADDTDGLRTRLALFSAMRIESTAFSLYGTVNAFPFDTRLRILNNDSKNTNKTTRCLALVSTALFIPMPWHFFCIFVKCVIVYPIAGLRCCVDHFLVFYLALIMQRFANMALGLWLASFTCDLNVGMILNGSGFLVNLLYSGTFYATDTVTWTLRWIEFIVPSYYTAEMMAQNELSGVAEARPLLDGSVKYDQVSLWLSFILLVTTGLVYYLLAILSLRMTLKSYRL